MPWVEKRGRYRLRDRIDDKLVTIIPDLGIWKTPADAWLVEYKKAVSLGFIPEPPITVAIVAAFNKAKAAGLESADQRVSLPIDEFCDLYLEHHGPSLKGGKTDHHKSNYYNLKCRLGVIKGAWKGKNSDQITKLHVRDFLARFNTIGTRLKYLATISHMYTTFEEWNEEPEILKYAVKLPPFNPAKKWRKKMKAAQKRQPSDTRVLSPEEWDTFKVRLTPRAYAICDIALRRFLRPADIKKISHLNISGGIIQGIQQKTGEPYAVPTMGDQPTSYDFTNFRREFHAAQVAAGMDYPVGHPLRFTVRTLRRTGATWAYRETRDLVGISKMLGHRKIETTIRYLNITDADIIAIAAAVDRLANRKRLGGAPVEQVLTNEHGVRT